MNEYHQISEFLEFDGDNPMVTGVVENPGTLNRLKPWIGDMISEELYEGRRVESKLMLEYLHGEDLYSFRLVFQEC
jgi:hypothetical protein